MVIFIKASNSSFAWALLQLGHWFRCNESRSTGIFQVCPHGGLQFEQSISQPSIFTDVARVRFERFNVVKRGFGVVSVEVKDDH